MNRVLVSVRRVGILLVIALFLSTASLYAQDATTGESTFKSKCAVCHGVDGRGKTQMRGIFPNIPDLHSEDVQKLSDEELIGVITNGKNGKMPAWGKRLKTEEIKSLVDYLRTFAIDAPEK